MGERLKELQYITFEELLNSVRTDFRSYELEGLIEPMELIKIAIKVNYDLGLKINSTKETIIDIDNGLAKLPADFDTMNFALLCYNYHTVTPTIGSGLETQEIVLSNTLTSGCTPCEIDHTPCPVISNPWKQDKVQSRCGGDVTVEVIQWHSNQVRCYRHFERIYFVPSKEASDFCINTQFRDCPNEAQIKNGFVYTSVNCGKMYINYQGAMEDAEGNLLVLDHPMINEYYEWALKERILSNLYLNGTPDIERRLQLAQKELRNYRNIANGIVDTPGFYELKEVLEGNRKHMFNKYFASFSKYFGQWAYISNPYQFGTRY